MRTPIALAIYVSLLTGTFAPACFAEDPMVIGEQHANPLVIFHHADSGISATTVVLPARDSTINLPPINSSRSRTPVKPVPSP